MPQLSTWLYPWDLVDEPVSIARVVESAALDRVDVAVNYHSLFATIPGRPSRPFVELGETSLYTAATDRIWWGAEIRPHQTVGSEYLGDALILGRALAEAAGCALGAWTVLLHDSAMSRRAPAAAVLTLWDRPLSAMVCLRHPHVRDYAARLVEDVGGRSDLVQLESAHWGALPHHRHVKPAGAGTPGGADIQARLLELCFCDLCVADAGGAGVDVPALRHQLKEVWTRAAVAAQSWAEVVALTTGLDAYLKRRAVAVSELIAALVAASPVEVEVVGFGDLDRAGLDLRRVLDAGAHPRVLAYGDERRVRDLVLAIKDDAELRAATGVGVSLLSEHVDSSAQFTAVLEAGAAASASIGVYHLGLVEPARREWLVSASHALRQTVAGRSAATRRGTE